MGFRKGQGGRPKGAKNKTTVAAKEAIASAFDELGGVKRLIAWVKADPLNERVFYGQVYPKLLPLQVGDENGGPVKLLVEWQQSQNES